MSRNSDVILVVGTKFLIVNNIITLYVPTVLYSIPDIRSLFASYIYN